MYFNKQHISEVLFKHGNMTVIDSQILSMQLLTEKVICLKTASCCPRLHQSINEVADAGTEVLLLLVCVLFTIICQPRNSVLIRRV